MGIRYAVSFGSFSFAAFCHLFILLLSLVSISVLTNTNTSYLIPVSSYLTIGVCCDSRRAVLIYSVIFAIFEAIGLIGGLMGYGLSPHHPLASSVLAILVVSIIIRFLTILGAKMYNKWIVGIGAIWEIIHAILWIVLSINISVGGTIVWSWFDDYSSPTWLSIVWTLVWSALLFYVSYFFFLFGLMFFVIT